MNKGEIIGIIALTASMALGACAGRGQDPQAPVATPSAVPTSTETATALILTATPSSFVKTSEDKQSTITVIPMAPETETPVVVSVSETVYTDKLRALLQYQLGPDTGNLPDIAWQLKFLDVNMLHRFPTVGESGKLATVQELQSFFERKSGGPDGVVVLSSNNAERKAKPFVFKEGLDINGSVPTVKSGGNYSSEGDPDSAVISESFVTLSFPLDAEGKGEFRVGLAKLVDGPIYYWFEIFIKNKDYTFHRSYGYYPDNDETEGYLLVPIMNGDKLEVVAIKVTSTNVQNEPLMMTMNVLGK